MGAHVLMMPSTNPRGDDANHKRYGRVSNVELRAVGQEFRMGRYPLHFHMTGTLRTSYLKNNSIHDSFNRAITLHGVHQSLVQFCSAYNIRGHAFFIEDGIETGNHLDRNIGALIKQSNSLLNTDHTPAVFWVSLLQYFFDTHRTPSCFR